jgi:hypothetical protein
MLCSPRSTARSPEADDKAALPHEQRSGPKPKRRPDLLEVERHEAALAWARRACRASIAPTSRRSRCLVCGRSRLRTQTCRQRRRSMVTASSVGDERDAHRCGFVPTQRVMDAQRGDSLLPWPPSRTPTQSAPKGTAVSAARQGGAVAPWLVPHNPTATRPSGHDIDIRRAGLRCLLAQASRPASLIEDRPL